MVEAQAGPPDPSQVDPSRQEDVSSHLGEDVSTHLGMGVSNHQDGGISSRQGEGVSSHQDVGVSSLEVAPSHQDDAPSLEVGVLSASILVGEASLGPSHQGAPTLGVEGPIRRVEVAPIHQGEVAPNHRAAGAPIHQAAEAILRAAGGPRPRGAEDSIPDDPCRVEVRPRLAVQ